MVTRGGDSGGFERVLLPCSTHPCRIGLPVVVRPGSAMHGLLVLALWLAADEELCCENLSIGHQAAWLAHLRVPVLLADRSSRRRCWDVDGYTTPRVITRVVGCIGFWNSGHPGGILWGCGIQDGVCGTHTTTVIRDDSVAVASSSLLQQDIRKCGELVFRQLVCVGAQQWATSFFFVRVLCTYGVWYFSFFVRSRSVGY